MSILNKLLQRILMTFSWGRNYCSHFANEEMDASNTLARTEFTCIWSLTSQGLRVWVQGLALAGSWSWLEVKERAISRFQCQWKNMLAFSASFPALHQLCIQPFLFHSIYFTGKLTTETRDTPLPWVLPIQISHDLDHAYCLECISWNFPFHAACSSHMDPVSSIWYSAST